MTIEAMDIRGWDERYRQKGRAREDFEAGPTQLVLDTAKQLKPGSALDLASGTGRNALWLAKAGWRVTAVDGSSAAIDVLRKEAERRNLLVDAKVADLHGDFRIQEANWDLIVIAYYLQRDLFEPAKRGVAPGGVLIAIVHTTEAGEEPTVSRLKPGELKDYFAGWEITHEYEGRPNDRAHKRRVAEIVARRPL
jgi:SAM-dependent methyltransferase